MCRLFAVLANEPVRIDRAFAALKRQALEHKDGWGVAIFNHGQPPLLEVSTMSASACVRFAKLGDAVSTTSMLAHLRLASVGGVREANSHPFSSNGFAFMHNGTLCDFEQHRRALEALIAPQYLEQLRGETDSERCFALFLTLLGEERSLEAMARALSSVVATVARVCDRAEAAPEVKPSAMNFMVTDGTQLVATRCGRTLFHSHVNGAHYVASEALWPESEWHEVAEGNALMIDASLTARQLPIRALAA